MNGTIARCVHGDFIKGMSAHAFGVPTVDDWTTPARANELRGELHGIAWWLESGRCPECHQPIGIFVWLHPLHPAVSEPEPFAWCPCNPAEAVRVHTLRPGEMDDVDGFYQAGELFAEWVRLNPRCGADAAPHTITVAPAAAGHSFPFPYTLDTGA